jgi:hypothetical protein
VTRHFLLVDGYDLSYALRRIHDELTGLETVTRRGFLLLGGCCHYALNSLLCAGGEAGKPAAIDSAKPIRPNPPGQIHASCKQ